MNDTGHTAAAKVLVVDDELQSARLLAKVLDTAGYDVIMACNGTEAVARAAAHEPDAVLLDLMLPDISGFEVCRRIRGGAKPTDAPVIFITGVDERDVLVQAYEAGGVDFVSKPIFQEELLLRVRTHVDLKRSRDRLEMMWREREDVVNVVAHDLKNPLACVLFNARLMQQGGRGRDCAELGEIIQCADEALAFIQRFLARGAAGERLRQFDTGELDLREMAADALRLSGAHARARQVELVLEGDGSQVRADRRAVRNVLQNLLSNAIKHSPAGETVTVSVGQSRNGYRQCLVRDRGPGLAETDRQRLFQRYVRLATAKDDYSSGLGLAIAKYDVDMMGGHLWHEQAGDGGCVFGFELPEWTDRHV